MNGRTKDDSDCEGVKHFEIQAKLRGEPQKPPTHLRLWVAGIRNIAEKAGKIGIVVWKEPGRYDDDALVVLTLKDWKECIKRWGAL